MRVFLPVLLLIHLAAALWIRPLSGDTLYGPDAYMRLNRVHHLVDSGAWADSRFPRSNAPHGETLHWTRLFDVVLIAMAAPAVPFIGFDHALHWAGILVSPLMHVLALLALLWATGPLALGRARFWVGALFVAQPQVLPSVGAGRADHHALLMLLFAIWLGISLRLFVKPFDKRRCVVAGAFAALCLWASIEALLFVATSLVALAVLFLIKNADEGRKLLHVLLGFAGGLWLCLFIERGVSAFAVEYDRISLVHASIFTVAFATLAGLLWLLRSRRWMASTVHRAWALALWSALVLGFVAAQFPRFFGGPMVDVDPRILPIWLDRVAEAQSLRSPPDFLWALGPSLVAVPFLVWAMWKNTSGLRRDVSAYLLLATVVHVAAAAYQMRFVTYVVVLVTVPVALLLVAQLDRCRQLPGVALRAVAKSTVVVAFVLGFPIVSMLLTPDRASPEPQSCDLTQAARFLNSLPGPGHQPKTILAFIDIGPELMYRTKHRVVATPYHRNTDGILDTYRVFSAKSDAAAKWLIDARQIDLLFLCLRPAEAAYYQHPAPTAPTLFDRLAGGRPPAWAHRLDVPTPTAAGHADFAVYEIVR